jgi:hypothetical protein
MSRSGQDAGGPPKAITPAGSSAPAPRASGFDHQVGMGLVGLGVVGHVLRSRRFYERVAVAAIAVAALRGIGQVNRANMMQRLAAWNMREAQRQERLAEHQARGVRGAGRMTRSGPSKDLAKKTNQT